MNSLLDNFHAFTPQPIGVSEYGAGASILQHEQGLTRAPKATVHEGAWAAIAKRPFVWGSFIWNMFDFASVGRNEGDSPQLNDKGLVTRDRKVRKVRKDAFFFYKAFWSPEPVLYITSRRAAIRVRPETQLPSSHLP
jgi:beta-galactosidase